MFKDNEELKKWLKDKYPYEEKSEEEIKKEFVDAFGIDKWNEIEAETKLDNLNFKLCNYLGIEPVPVIFEEMDEDARYYDKLNYIAISNRYVFDEVEQMKSLIHEVKHLHQKYCISHKNENHKFSDRNLINRWKDDFKKNQKLIPIDILMCIPVELDAYAFTKYILKSWFNIDYHHHDLIYDTVLSFYIEKYFK
jgi:hypothetical protein